MNSAPLPYEADNGKPLEVLKLMVAAEGGELMIVETLGGTDFQVGKDNINKSQDARELAYLHDAVDELAREGMIKVVNKGKGFSLFNVTATGYKAVDGLAKE